MRQTAAEGYKTSYGLPNVAIPLTFVPAFSLPHCVFKRHIESSQDSTWHKQTGQLNGYPDCFDTVFGLIGLPTAQALIAWQLDGDAGVAAHDACTP